MMLTVQIFWFGVTLFLSQTDHVTSHGHLFQPAQRSSAWRAGYNNPINQRDHQLWCGGFWVQWNAANDGRCGACGDPFSDEVKPNEDVDGKYVVNGVITGSYDAGQVMIAKVNITAYHKGWFEFRLCPLATPTTKVTQECLNQTKLELAGSNTSRMILEDIKDDDGVQIYVFNLQLPPNMTCERCVLQWRYNTGNSWGYENGHACTGCGKQENFVNCADIRITDAQNGTTTTQTSSSAGQSTTTTGQTSSTISTSSTTTTATTTTSTSSAAATTTTNENTYRYCSAALSCRAVAPFSATPGMKVWCCDNCSVGFCPPTHCYCIYT